ncbi:hypothetical protein J8J40_30655, partial [Mycobacterium tuberculosis]|nr:hypothetical protein [Mycobacterium tuberculosis]
LFIGSIGHAMLPGLARAIREGRQRSFWLQLAAAAGLVILLSLAGAVLASLIGSALVEAIYGPAFAGQGHLLVLAVVAARPA